MAVLIEAISVIMKVDVLRQKYPGGWEAFRSEVPNRTLCADGELARVGFMAPGDVEDFVRGIEAKGLTFVSEGNFADIAVVDQVAGPTGPCDWVDFGTVELQGGGRIIAARLRGSTAQEVALPENWRFEGSLSQQYTLVPSAHFAETMKFLRHEDGVDVYLDLETGKEVYMGRASGTQPDREPEQ